MVEIWNCNLFPFVHSFLARSCFNSTDIKNDCKCAVQKGLVFKPVLNDTLNFIELQALVNEHNAELKLKIEWKLPRIQKLIQNGTEVKPEKLSIKPR